ncbi:hypothetical protein KA093_02840 [Candidatus Saccharibacteria bacterium]|nr:hypothetical protein [Candidatus Saccharibacteria bacterium]
MFHLKPILQNSLNLVRSDRSSNLSNRMNFHSLNLAFLRHWRQVMLMGTSEIMMPPLTHQEAQILLAGEAVQYMRLRDRIPPAQYYSSDEGPHLKRKTWEGILNEFDTGIVLLEIAKRHTDWIVIPAPGGFEHGNKNANVDFIVLDTTRQEIIGVQTKTAVSDSDYQHYDNKRVVLVDGMIDFGNISLRNPNSQYPVSTAGIISAHKLTDRSVNNKAFGAMIRGQRDLTLDNRLIMQLKLFAREKVGKFCTPQIGLAANRIEERLEAAFSRSYADYTASQTPTY